MEKKSEEEQRASQEQNKKKGVIRIPSYQEVFGGGTSSSSAPQPYNPPPPPSFSQAFSFIKASEFYTPPPPTSDPSPRHVAAEPQASATPTLPAGAAASSSSGSAPSSFYSSAIASAQNRNAILVSHRQRGNPLLKHIRNVRWAFADVVCDYLLGQSTCALYISLRYHLLHPDYLYYRIRELQKNFKLRVVLCHVDVEDVVKPLLEVTRTAMLHDCTLLCGWSLEECGRYLETIKVYENKPADSIREQMDTDYLSRLTHALTTVRHVNKTDVVTLGSAFGSLSHIMDASMEDLARCPGIGERKVKRLYDTFHEPFKRVSSRPTIAVPETPIKDKNSEESIPTDIAVEVEGKNSDSSKAEKESSLDVRSALTAAFDKYAERVRKRDRKSELFEPGEGSSSGSVAPKDAEA
ncbi:DNA excision repair protein ERCC-1 [Phoenix dactylifera]|uniref:DNA excision repair protein ERCC-1 n=1 Tax=Phoenix dactylifera TaxID=42345 RepID=A0A8B7CQD8_PHODC|nr:DNA excision repair protein ERCC-1 [Phoenix dactylifera]